MIKGGINMQYEVVYTKTIVDEMTITANSFDEAKKEWEELGLDADLFLIRDETGDEIIYD